MKLRITRKELDALTFVQKQNLCDLWIPNLYDVAVATVCTDAAEEKFEQITYVIGGIKLLKHHDILLSDIKFMPDEQFKVQEEEAYSDNIASDRIDGIEDLEESEKNQQEDQKEREEAETDQELEQEFSFDEDFNFEFQRPDSYSKQDCVPLLDIGQMIEILESKNFGQGGFYLSAAIDDYIFEMGKDDISSNTILDPNSKNCELCDILWESVKALL
ncbi:MAG: hypothetical protein ACYDG2_11720 [Ruminiclostridium sp.]